MTEPKFEIQWLFGTVDLKPVEYRIAGGKLALPWWQFWGPREEWTVHSPFMSIGPFDNYPEAAQFRDRLQAVQ